MEELMAESLLQANAWMWIAPAVLGLIGLLLFFSGVGRLFRGKLISGPMGAATGGVFIAGGAAVALLGMNLHTYNRLAYEQPVAEISLRKTGEQAFIATVRQSDGQGAEYDLLGDEWQIDARALKWKPWANVLGLDSQYRLERLAGRYQDIAAERTAPRSVHQLAKNPGLDLWNIARNYGRYLPVVDTLYGSGAYMPMADGASYQVTISQSGGLIARPTNDAARAAVQGWK
jgi:hypothetical protein